MADDVNPALRAELEAALAVLEPQIKGLHDLVRVSISPELQQMINTQIEIRERRRTLILAILHLLDSIAEAIAHLKKDGYPDIEGADLDAVLFSELTKEGDALIAAIEIFKAIVAKNLAVELGSPANKTVSKP